MGPAPETARPPRPPAKREADEDTEERDEEDTDYEEKVPRRKKRKKKKKKSEAVGPSGAHIAMVVGGLFALSLLALPFMRRGSPASSSLDLMARTSEASYRH